MDIKRSIVNFSLDHYKGITYVMVLATLVLGAFFPWIRIDTDPENMLSEDKAVRVFHRQTKEDFVLNDMVVVGIVNNKNAEGVFNVTSLTNIYNLTEFARSWRSQKDPNEGVVEVDLLAPSLVDNISQGGPGVIKFEWLMPTPPTTEAEALVIRDKVMSNPMLKGTIVSEDGRALCLYMPLTRKDISHELYTALSEKIATFTGDDEFHITGLPVAEDTFGYEMFVQMAISAPLAMAVIFILMLLFFRKLILVISPMIVALVSVITTMGLLIAFGHPVHIMSSMIPIFLMPIAVVDSVHILSEFFDLYTKEKGRRETITEVMSGLFMPMLYTSLTSAVGFVSLAMTPIPPVQTFGLFVATGIMIAWVTTILFVPAYVMMINESRLENFGASAVHQERQTRMSKLLRAVGAFTYRAAKPILVVVVLAVGVAIYGITQIKINDNPIKWFAKTHPIRRADMELNQHFGGTYMAYLVFTDNAPARLGDDPNYVGALRDRFRQTVESMPEIARARRLSIPMEKQVLDSADKALTRDAYLEQLIEWTADQEADANDANADTWLAFTDFFEKEKETVSLFKRPDMLDYLARLQAHLQAGGLVGKSNSVADIVKKVHQELIDGDPASYRIPETSAAVAQCLMQFQSSHTPDDLWHFVTKDFRRANIWLQLKSGDNRDMARVVNDVRTFVEAHPLPANVSYDWAGLTYINVIWQDEMVKGMLKSLLGSFATVFILMVVLFRSPIWGLLCMIPLSITIVVIYGVIGLIGKDYDMPVAVLSALTLGMAVDFAIHFLERARSSYRKTGSWQQSIAYMFGEPAQAITRNVLVIAIGFLPLLAAPLIPYKTVGIFLCAIMALSGIVTLLVLPAVLTLLEKKLLSSSGKS